MELTKMSLANIRGKLSRAEMKKIMAGSGSGNCCTHDAGWYGWNCSYANLNDAEANASNEGGYYCCDSCTSSWTAAHPNCSFLTVC